MFFKHDTSRYNCFQVAFLVVQGVFFKGIFIWMGCTAAIMLIFYLHEHTDQVNESPEIPLSLKTLTSFLVSVFLGRAVWLFYEQRLNLENYCNDVRSIAFLLSTW